MTGRQWIQRVLAHDAGVPVPFQVSLSPVARRKLAEFYGTDDVEEFLHLPMRMTAPRSVKPLYASPEEFGERVTDEFGVTWTTSRIDRGCPVGGAINAPSLAGYTLPDPAAERRFEHLGPWCARHADSYTVVWAGDLWERATFLCGMERLLLYVALEPAFVAALLDALADYIVATMDVLFARFEFDCVALSDDYGTQRALLVSPETWRQLVRPRLARVVDRAKAAGRDVMLHSCGHVRPIVPDLIELGIDILHPVQPEAMDLAELKRSFGGDLTFCGGLGTQELLVRAAPEAVRAEVRRLKRLMGRGGGYILEPGITLQADVPLANMLAMIDEARAL